MPNRRTHRAVGLAVGTAAAAYCARHDLTPIFVAELVGGAIGGWIGGITPDVLEPSTSPNHRNVAHSAVAGSAVLLTGISGWQAFSRHRAEVSYRLSRTPEAHPDARAWAELRAVLWGVLAGVITGFVAAYLSHLALDATTKRGIPLLTR